jgi:membrane protein required for beta-lactamase induction
MIPFAIASNLQNWNHVLIWTGPIVMAVFFRFSAWLMDVRSMERRPDYQQVIDRVSPLMLWPPKKNKP